MHDRRVRLHNPRMPASRPAPLPAYALYGEPHRGADAAPLHLETIAARSRLHGWDIRPHRHEMLLQLIVMGAGAVDVHLDGRAQRLEGTVLIVVPPLTAHGFRFSQDVDGWVVSIDEAHARALLAADLRLGAMLAAPAAVSLAGAAAHALGDGAAALAAAWARDAPWRHVALDAALLTLLVEAARALPLPASGAGAEQPARALAQVRRYRTLVERDFRRQPKVGAFAAELGITAAQLNRQCRRVLGHSALGVLHARLQLEAERELAYGGLSIKQVALGLGFRDAAYFSRFFARHAGVAPGAWRRRYDRGGFPPSAAFLSR